MGEFAGVGEPEAGVAGGRLASDDASTPVSSSW
jgi:hypothetical protein